MLKLQPEPDPAAIYAIADSLVMMAMRSSDQKDAYLVSDTYGGQDHFFRAAMRVAKIFEEWACKHVDFKRISGIYVYQLQDNFAKTLERLKWPGAPSIYTLDNFTESHCLRIAELLELPLI